MVSPSLQRGKTPIRPAKDYSNDATFTLERPDRLQHRPEQRPWVPIPWRGGTSRGRRQAGSNSTSIS